MIYLIALLAAAFTLIGGYFAFSNRRYLHLILAFTAGILLGLVSFELLPEVFELTQELAIDPVLPMSLLVAGFLGFHILQKLFVLHDHHEDTYKSHHHPATGLLSAIGLVGHSFLDGLGIGAAFTVDAALGAVVAVAVLAHKATDGVNTVSLMLANGNSVRSTWTLLGLNALAPVLGIILASTIVIPEVITLSYLSLFAGFILYICASDILPEAHRSRNSRTTLALTIVGVLTMLALTRIMA